MVSHNFIIYTLSFYFLWPQGNTALLLRYCCLNQRILLHCILTNSCFLISILSSSTFPFPQLFFLVFPHIPILIGHDCNNQTSSTLIFDSCFLQFSSQTRIFFSIYIFAINDDFHAFYTCFPFYTYCICRDRMTQFIEPSGNRNPFHSGDRDRGLGFPFLAHSPNLQWIYPFCQVAKILNHRSHLWSPIATIDVHTTTPFGTFTILFLPSLAETESACSCLSRIDLASF